MKVTIDKQFADLIPGTSATEDAEFERSVIQDGRILNPLIVWKHQNILLDGHRRNRLMTKHPTLKAPPPVVLDLESRQEAHDWIIHHQLNKRNVTPEQKRYLLGKLYLDHKPPQGKAKPEEASGLENAAKIAEKEGVSEKTVRESANFAEAVDAVAEVAKEIKNAVLSGDVKATTKDLEAVAELPAKQAAALAKKVESGKVKSIKEALPKREKPARKNGAEVGEGLKREVLKDLGRVKRGLDSLRIYSRVKSAVEAIHQAIKDA